MHTKQQQIKSLVSNVTGSLHLNSGCAWVVAQEVERPAKRNRGLRARAERGDVLAVGR